MFNVMEANTDGAGCTVMESEQVRFQRSAGVRERGMYREKRCRTWETPSGSISFVPVWVCVYNNKEGMQTTDGESDIFILLRGRESRLHGEGICSDTQHAQETCSASVFQVYSKEGNITMIDAYPPEWKEKLLFNRRRPRAKGAIFLNILFYSLFFYNIFRL